MEGNNNLNYRIYEDTFKRAIEAGRAGRMREAKKLYLEASDALLLAAKEAGPVEKKIWMERAKRLIMLSDSVVISQADNEKPAASTGPALPNVNINLSKDTKPVPPPKSAVSKAPSAAPRASDSSRGGSAANRGKINSGDDENDTVFIPSEKPNVHFEDIAGLDYVKETINRRIILPRRHPEIYKAFDRSLNSGILLYGPPGTGKTMIAKAIATEIDAVFFSIRCSDIVGKFFGEAEKNVKALFETARSQECAILFFDEFEALAAKRGGHSTVMNRLVPELLSQIDGFTTDPEKSLILLAATNRPWDLDSAFLRPPRLTEKIYVGLPDAAAREYLINRKFQKLPLSGEFSLEEVVELTEGFNAADVNEFCEAMKDGAIQRTLAMGNGTISPITREDLETAVQMIHSSVQQSDITALQKWEATQNIG